MIKLLNVPSLYASLYQVVNICKNNPDKEIEIIVPDKLSLFMEKFLFEKLGIVSSFNIKVVTLNRFAKKNISIPKDKQLTNNGSVLLIYKILNENRESFNSLKSHKYSFAYAENIYATISQLKASRITPDEMENFNNTDARLTGKIKDLALIYRKYEALKAGLLDVSDVFMTSVFSVASGRENANLLFVGFDDFTAIQYAIIENLALCANVQIFNYISTNQNARIYNREVYSQLRNISYINQLPFEVENVSVNISATKQFLQENLFALNNQKHILSNEIVKVFEANNQVEQIEYVARDIRSKILNGNKYEDFGVACYGLENNLSKIKEIFDKYEINYYIDNNLTLNNSVFYKFLISIFKFNENSFNSSHLIDIINSPFYVCENNVKRALIERILMLKCDGLNLEKYDFKEDLNEQKTHLADFLNSLKIDKSSNVESIIEVVKNACEKYGFADIINNLVLQNEDMQNQMLLSKSIELSFGLLNEIKQFYFEADFSMVADIFMRMASVVKISNLPLSLDSVKIVDADNVMEIFNNLYLINCSAENAPSVKHDCGIILDNEIEKLNFSFKLSPTISHINKLSKLRLFNTALLYENSLTLSYVGSSSELIKELCAKLQFNHNNHLINFVPIYNVDFGKHIALSEWDYIEYLCRKDNKNKKLFKNLIKNKEIDNLSLQNLNIYENLKTISASQLESYFKCPFYAFLNNTLKIQPKLENDILSLDIGNILHDILFKYYSLNKQVGDIKSFVEKQVYKFINKDERLKINADSPVIKNLIDEAVRVIDGMEYLDKNSLFKTDKNLLEVEFTNSNALKLKNINLIGKIDRVDITGNMARIIDYKSGKADATLKELYYGNKLQLFLYSCACENWLKKNVVGNFYLPLHNKYERDAGNTYSLKGFFINEQEIVHALDSRLQPGDKSDIVNLRTNKENKAVRTIGYKELTPNEMHALKEYSKLVSEQAVEEIKSGYIKPTPSEISSPCEYCAYSHICLKDSSNIKYRQAKKIVPESFKRGKQ